VRLAKDDATVVLIAIVLVALTGWNVVDPLIALAVAVNILWTGYRLLGRSARGLLDEALPQADRTAIAAVLNRYEARGIHFHALRTRQAAGRSFISVHVLVPGAWTVQHGHDVMEDIERRICDALPNTTITTHMEPIEDPVSWRDADLPPVGAATPGKSET